MKLWAELVLRWNPWQPCRITLMSLIQISCSWSAVPVMVWVFGFSDLLFHFVDYVLMCHVLLSTSLKLNSSSVLCSWNCFVLLPYFCCLYSGFWLYGPQIITSHLPVLVFCLIHYYNFQWLQQSSQSSDPTSWLYGTKNSQHFLMLRLYISSGYIFSSC